MLFCWRSDGPESGGVGTQWASLSMLVTSEHQPGAQAICFHLQDISCVCFSFFKKNPFSTLSM